MKHPNAEEQCRLLWSSLPSEPALAEWDSLAPRFTHFVELLLQSAHARKLLSRSQRNSESLWWHVFDSLHALELIRPDSERLILDAGSGNGFPGLPLALALPEIQFGLVERSGSKVEFLEFALASLAVSNATVHAQEIDTRTWSSMKPDLVIMRALVPASQLPLLFPPGNSANPPLLVFTTADKSSEWEHSATSSGYVLAGKHAYILPETGARRETLKFTRT